MDLTSPIIIKELLSKYKSRPSKGLGQNFLIDKNVLKKIIESADIKPNDVILEVGSGIGTLTQVLAQKASKIIAVEKDKIMCKILEVITLQSVKNVQIVNADILRYKPKVKNYKLVANIPYYLTSPLIRKFLEADNPPSKMILMLQKEVAQRICSKPPDMSLLAVSVQFYATPEIIFYVSKNCFWPSPKVDSAIIKITPFAWAHSHFASQKRASAFRMLFFKIVRAGFSQPRKQLAGNLSKMLKLEKERVNNWLLKNGVKPNQRAETLNVSDWIKLTKTLTP